MSQHTTAVAEPGGPLDNDDANELTVVELHCGFPFTPLNETKSQFRLIRVIGFDLECINCELGIFSLSNDDTPQFTALSYKWGDDQPKFSVNVDRHRIPIRRNLYTFLAQMCAEHRRDWLFIDALCIDQGNKAELINQVQLMGKIYQHAEGVMAWIVYEPYHTDEENKVIYDPLEEPYDVSEMSYHERKQAVMENSYWSRLWILQEILLAKKLTVRFGDAEIDWRWIKRERKLFEKGALPVKNDNLAFRQDDTEPRSNTTTAQNILAYRRYMADSLRSGTRLPFNRAFDFFALQRCSRPHDKVFGYLGLTNSRIRVDYSMPILDLFVATLADYLMSAGFITENLLKSRGQWKVAQGELPVAMANDLIAPFLVFELDPFDSVISLLFTEVVKFFAPGLHEGIYSTVVTTWWMLKRMGIYSSQLNEFLNSDDARWEVKYIGCACIKFVKFAVAEGSTFWREYKDAVDGLKNLAKQDAILTTIDGSDSRMYSEWVEYVRRISEEMWQRFQESGEDADGDMDDESWTLIA